MSLNITNKANLRLLVRGFTEQALAALLVTIILANSSLKSLLSFHNQYWAECSFLGKSRVKLKVVPDLVQILETPGGEEKAIPH